MFSTPSCSGSKSDGHLGCSNGYDGLAYKPYLHKHFNSEGREQVHSLLEKVSSSFRQTNVIKVSALEFQNDARGGENKNRNEIECPEV